MKIRAHRNLQAIVGLTLIAVALIVGCFISLRDTHYDDIERGKEPLSGSFVRYDDHVYAVSAGDGYYRVVGADARTFKPLGVQGFAPLGQDAHAVYCGDQVIPGLLPDAARVVAEGYVADAQRAWFCGQSVSDPAYRSWQALIGSVDERSANRVKYQRFPVVPLPRAHVASLHAINRVYVGDDVQLFYQGHLVVGADPANVQSMSYVTGEAKGRVDDAYIRDSRAVYYRGVQIEDAAAAAFDIFRPDNNDNADTYGFDRASGRYYFNGQKFPASVDGVDAQSLRVLLTDRDHANQDLFVNEHGIFFWDTQRNQLRFACVPPAPGLHAVDRARSIFTDGQSLYGTSAIEHWAQSRSSKTLESRETALYRIPDVTPGQLQRLGDLQDKDASSLGTLWQAGNHLFYVPRFGQGNFFTHSIYAVADLQRLRATASSGGQIWSILSVVNQIKGVTVCVAKSEYQ